MRVAALAVLTAIGPGCAWGTDWFRLSTSHFELLTDGGGKAARATLDRLEQIRGVLATPPMANRAPLRVFLFGSEAEFRAYADSPRAKGFYRSGGERDFIVLHGGAGLTRAAAHEYVHRILQQGETPLPLWFEEGTAELYSNLGVGSKQMTVGQPIPEHLSALASGKWLAAGELTGANRRSAVYNERERAGMFYAQSWALVHMLNLAPGWSERMGRFAELLADGDADAFRQAFGKSTDEALKELHGYLSRMTSVSVEAPVRTNESVTIERVGIAAAELACADLAVRLGRTALARKLVEAAKKAQPKAPEAEAGLGDVALAEGKTGEARARFEHAIAMGSRDAELRFQLAILERDEGAPASQVDALLRQAVARDPGLGEAQLLLGLQAHEPGLAVEHLKAAARALPERSYVWHELGLAQAKTGEMGAARISGLRALQTAGTEQEERMAESLLDSLK
jgi:tetratricopeptide (TPR) repeat protein